MQDQVNPTRAPKRVPWNKGKLTGAKPPLRPKHVWSIRTKLHIEGRTRERVFPCLHDPVMIAARFSQDLIRSEANRSATHLLEPVTVTNFRRPSCEISRQYFIFFARANGSGDVHFEIVRASLVDPRSSRSR